MRTRALVAGPRRLEWDEPFVPVEPANGCLRVRSRISLISPGTELRLFRGESMPTSVWKTFADLDSATLRPGDPTPARYRVANMDGPPTPMFPVSTGYNSVGIVEAIGDGVEGLSPGGPGTG
jgi:hypothetical protein